MTRILHRSLLLAGLLLPAHAAAACPPATGPEQARTAPAGIGRPRAGHWVAYAASFHETSTRPSGGHSVAVGEGDGGYPAFSLRLHPGPATGAIVSDLQLHRFVGARVEAEAGAPQDGAGPVPGPYRQLWRSHGDLLAALDRHRPPMRLSLSPQGEAAAAPHPRLPAFEACSRRALERSFARRIALAPDAEQRRLWQARLDRAGVPPTPDQAALHAPSLLLGLLALSLPPATGTIAYEALRRNSEERRSRGAPPDPLFEAMRRYGRQAALDVDLVRGGSAPAAWLCRSVRVDAVPGPVADRCRIEAVYDTRDGWPIALSISRQVTGAVPWQAGQTDSFHRLPPGAAGPGPS